MPLELSQWWHPYEYMGVKIQCSFADSFFYSIFSLSHLINFNFLLSPR